MGLLAFMLTIGTLRYLGFLTLVARDIDCRRWDDRFIELFTGSFIVGGILLLISILIFLMRVKWFLTRPYWRLVVFCILVIIPGALFIGYSYSATQGRPALVEYLQIDPAYVTECDRDFGGEGIPLVGEAGGPAILQLGDMLLFLVDIFLLILLVLMGLTYSLNLIGFPFGVMKFK